MLTFKLLLLDKYFFNLLKVTLFSDLKKYIVQKVDTVSIEDEIIYIRAVLQIYTEGDTNILA